MSFILGQIKQDFDEYKYNFNFKLKDETVVSQARVLSLFPSRVQGESNLNAPVKALNSFILRTPTRLYYDTFYFIPNYLDLGNINNDFEIDILVWNAHFYPNTLNEITYDKNQGITLIAPENKTFDELELKPIKVVVKKDGTSVVSVLADVGFGNGVNVKMPINGTRQLVVAYIPEQSFDETIEYKTEISSSRRVELRAKTSSNPIRTLKYHYKLPEQILAKYLSIYKYAQARTYVTPLWQEMIYFKQLLHGTKAIPVDVRYRNFKIGSSVIIWENEKKLFITNIKDINNGFYQLQDALPTTYRDCLVLPTFSANILENISITRELNGIFNSEVSFVEPNSDLQVEPLTLPFLNGTPVLERWQNDGAMNISQNVTIINDTFARPFIHINEDKALVTLSFNGLSTTLDEYHDWLDFFDYCSGRFRTFWLPTLGNELKLADRADINANSIAVVESNDFNDRCAIRISRGSGCGMQFFYAKITKAYNQNGKTYLSLDRSIPFAMELDNLIRLCLMFNVRMVDDAITIRHKNYYTKEISFTATETL